MKILLFLQLPPVDTRSKPTSNCSVGNVMKLWIVFFTFYFYDFILNNVRHLHNVQVRRKRAKITVKEVRFT
jgi:hypothetical protein